MPQKAREYWADRTPGRRRPTYPACRGEHTADLVVIGGGLTGATAAYVAAASGLDVVLLEEHRLACGRTAASPGIVTADPHRSFRAAENAHGLRVTKAAWRAARHGALDLAATLRRTRVRCDLEPTSLIVNARTPEAASALQREQRARKEAGFEAPWLSGQKAMAEIGTASSGAMRVRDAFTLDPVRAALGLAAAAARRGARIFEHSEVRRTRFDRKRAEVVLADARIATRQVFVATGTPRRVFGSLQRHVRQRVSFAVVTEPLSAPMRRESGQRQCILTEWDDSPHWLRWLADDRALFAGHAGPAIPARQLDKALSGHASELMYELSVRYPVISGLPLAYGWPQVVTETLDGLPWIGAHRNFPFHFFAFGLDTHFAGLAAFAARAAVRALASAPERDDDAFAR